jgi:hypothetical protein
MFPIIFGSPPENTYVRLVTQAQFDTPQYVKSTVMSVSPEDLIRVLGTDQNVFFAPAVLKTKGDGKGDVAASKVVWVDCDTPAPLPASIPPSILVKSGHGWHYYWVLDTWLTNIPLLEKLNKLFEDDVDPPSKGCWNANRLLRVPSSINKKPDKPPVPCTLHSIRPLVYTIDELQLVMAFPEKLCMKLKTGDSRGYKSHSERDWAICTGLLRAGAQEDFIRKIVPFSAWGDEVRNKSEHYLTRTLERAAKRAGETSGEGGKPTGTILEVDNAYYLVLSSGVHRKISTFTIEPTLLLEHSEGDAIIGDVRAVGTDHVWRGVTFTRRAFNGHGQLVKELPLAAWQFLGGDVEVRYLLPHLMTQLYNKGMPKVKATSVLGRHGDAIVGVNHVITKEGLRGPTDSPLVYLGTGRERPAFLFGPVRESPTLPFEVGLLGQLNDPTTIYPIAGWFAAAAIKPLLETIGVRMPILNCTGTRGSGKTTTVHLFQRLFGTTTPVSYNANTTHFVSLTLLGSSNSVPISFSEYRASHNPTFLRYILLSYDTGHDARGQMDQTTRSYPLIAPFVVDGEDAIADAAAKERIIVAPFHPEALTLARKEVLNQLEKVAEDFAFPFLYSTLDADVEALWKQAYGWVQEQFPEKLPDRIRNNLAVVCVGWLLLQLQPQRAWLEASLSAVYDSKKTRTAIMADDFIEAVVNAAARRTTDFVWFTEGKDVVRIHFATAFTWYAQLATRTRASMFSKDALRAQLNERYGTGPGQYLLPPVQKEGYLCIGVHLSRAAESGLDVKSYAAIVPQIELVLEDKK